MSTRKKKTEAPEETVETLAAEAEEPEAAEESADAEAVIYIGPTIRNVIANGRVLTGGLPPELEKKIEEIPALRGLIVPISELSTAMQTVRKPKTALNNLYLAVSEKLKK